MEKSFKDNFPHLLPKKKNPNAVSISITKTYTVTYTEGEKCPKCNGTGSRMESGDCHRSAGMVPCRAQYFDDTKQKFMLECVRGTLTKF